MNVNRQSDTRDSLRVLNPLPPAGQSDRHTSLPSQPSTTARYQGARPTRNPIGPLTAMYTSNCLRQYY
ncbi:hypothetical protein ASPBRDRAFT_460819 [Aspergillus brasiliensis CBS 101740]|uniref:Uncharacterized protein n=1 Tax=Aspergillus brasiliensis (strain CBS 101740 / IMI 381727 / IBT 21946) TaxID=767769 RepID=A0A1L9USM9_ASPBC|nr:hypothetical protein ASPBRDRAFT_460819 [Aspergillus brasiliensis CBS 101740]